MRVRGALQAVTETTATVAPGHAAEDDQLAKGGCMNEHLIALLLILSPGDPAGLPERTTPARHRALEEVAYCLELWPLDKGGWGPDYSRDVGWCRRTYRELQGCPPLADAHRFPPHAVAVSCLEFSCKHICYLESIEYANLHRGDDIREALSEARWCQSVWEAVRDAGGDGVITRRFALQRLRDLLGDGAFYSGQLPPWVPVWRFREIR